MSYDINLCDPISGETIQLDSPHQLRGGTFVLGGTTEAWLNITYNYGKHYCRVLDGEKGIRVIYGMSGADSIPVLQKAIAQLGDDTSSNYWDSTEGNAKAALCGLLALAKLRPDGVWQGD